jgi:hypothetical protein
MQRVVVFLRRYESAIAALAIAAGITVLAFGFVPPTVTCVVGDMRWRYDALVPAQIANVHLDAQRLGVGFGAAAIGGWDGLGDALAVGGRVFVRHTNRAAPRYYGLAVNRYFQSNAFVYVPARRAPDVSYRLDANTRMDQLLETLARAYPQGVVAAGVLRFAPLRTIAMSAPAVAGEPVTQRAVRYYTRPMEDVKESWAYVVLAAARAGDERLAAVLPPAAMRTIPAGHALALRLRAAPTDTATAPAENAVSVGQLLRDAIAVEGQLALYPISHTFACAEALATPIGALSH